MGKHAETLAFLAALSAAGLSPAAFAQSDSLLRPPRIERRADAPAPTAPRPANVGATPVGGEAEVRPSPPPILGSPRPPNAATLAPLPEERADKIDEIIVLGQGWRLPDLGSEWRKKQEDAEDTGRFHVTFMPLYDPNRPPLRNDILLAAPEWQRHGYIELFRMRFGKRGSAPEQE